MSPAPAASEPGQYDLDHHGDADLGPADGPGQLNLAVNVRLPRPPSWLLARLQAALTGLASYPRQDAAVAAVAARHGRDTSDVLLTNGAAEACTLFARALHPRRAVCVHPSFTAPEAALRAAGHAVERVLLPPPFVLDPALIPDDADLVVLGNPTNPTGLLHPLHILEELARPGRTLVVDEAFADAVPGEPATLSGRCDLPGVIVLRSLTKTWGLAGLRVGYVLGAPVTLQALRRAQPLWPLNALALEALAACSEPAAVTWADDQARRTAGWRADLAAALNDVPGVSTDPLGQAPFLLVRVPDASQVRSRLRELGIAVRRGDTFPGLDDRWVRIAVAAPEHHERIVDCFARCTSPTWHPATPAPGPRPRAAGRVTLVGAGPGSTDLITLRGWQALHSADVVISDRLADPGLTAELRPGVLLIDAGKAPRKHRLSQDEINTALVAHAQAGRHVVRLKGGDPFVLGRGGEEVLACAEAGIRCSVVPGLSSATAAPALAGIPLTHRGAAQSFTVVSGHLPPGHPHSPLDWGTLARSADTLVLLMAVANLTRIAQCLLELGKPPGTAVACIEQAATARQQITRCTLHDLARPAKAPAIGNPAVIVIGPTGLGLAAIQTADDRHGEAVLANRSGP
jgi:histidinol-phosphate aminotransferase